MEDEEYYNGVKSFLLGWEIDTPHAVDFMRCTREDQEKIMGTFSPASDEVEEINKEIQAVVFEYLHSAADAPSSVAMSDRLQDFANTWGLNRNAMARLQMLPADQLEHAMESFAPPRSTRDTSANLLAFLRKVKRERPKEQREDRNVDEIDVPEDDDDPYRQFAKKWGLGNDALERLRDLPPEVAAAVMDEFAPPSSTRDMTGKFIAFVKKMSAKHESPMPQQEHAGDDQDGPDSLEQFAQKWGFNEAAMERLSALPPDLLEETMESFRPPSGTRDYSAKLLFFIDEFIDGEQFPESELLQDFVEKWSLSNTAKKRLQRCPPEVQEEVIEKFAPAAGTRDVSSKLMAFIKSKKTFRRPAGQDFATDDTRPPADTGPLEAFAEKWNLNEEAVDMFVELPPHVRDDVMATFAPRDGTRDVNKLFISFARSLASNASKPAWPPIRAPEPESANTVDAFALKWNLDQQAVNLLIEQPWEVQDELMAAFQPPEGTDNVSSKFMAFVKAKVRGGQRKMPPRPSKELDEFAHRWGLDERAYQTLCDLPSDLQQQTISTFAPGPNTRDVNGKFMGFVKRSILTGKYAEKWQGEAQYAETWHQSGHQNPRHSLYIFSEKWGLNEHAWERLSALPIEQQDEAMATFAPNEGTRDYSAKFVAFLRTLGKHARQESYPSYDAIDRFARKWQLSSWAVQILQELPGSLQEQAMEKFSPPADTRDYTARFIAFTKIIRGEPPRKRQRYEGWGGYDSPEAP